MTRFFLTLNFLFILLCRAEIPLTVCSNDRPFKTKEHTCADFNEICVKNGDLECDNFQKACTQCPPTNYSVLMFLDIILLKKQILQQDAKIEIFSNFSDNNLKKIQNFMSETDKSVKIWFTFSFVLLVVILAMTTIFYYKLKNAILKNMHHKTDILKKEVYFSDENISKSKDFGSSYKLRNRRMSNESISKSKDFGSSYKLLNTRISNISVASKDTNAMTTFQFLGSKSHFEMLIPKGSNIVEIKRKICHKQPHAKPYDYKIMQLKYDNKILDDNAYLHPLLYEENPLVYIQILTSLNPRDIIVINIHSEHDIPDEIQIDRHKPVSELKKIISQFIPLFNFSLFKENEELLDESSLEDYKIKDNDWIKVLGIKGGKVTVNSIFKDGESFSIKYSNMDRVSLIFEEASQRFSCDSSRFVLFLDGLTLDERKYFHEYKIDDDSTITFFCLKMLNDITIEDSPIDEEYNSSIYRAKYDSSNKDIIIMKYKLSIPEWKECDCFLKQVKTLQITKQSERFVQLFGMYMDDDYIYEVWDNLCKERSLRNYLQRNQNPSERIAAEIILNIMKSLKYLQHNNIPYDHLIPYDIMIDENRNIKLLSLGLYKFFKNDKSQIIKNIFENKYSPLLAYIAPEIRQKDLYNIKCNVWSLGVLLIYIKDGYLYKDGKHPVIRFDENHKAKYSLPIDTSNFMKHFIDSCIQFDPNKRLTLDQLMKHKFIERNCRN